MTVSLSDLVTGSLSALIITLGVFHLLRAGIVYRSARHESFAFAGMALFFGLYLLLQPVAFRQDAVSSLPWLRLRMILLSGSFTFLTWCLLRVTRLGEGPLRFLPLLPVLPLVFVPFDFYVSLPVRLELVRFFGEVLPYRVAAARTGLHIHFAVLLLTGALLIVVLARSGSLFRRFPFPWPLLPFPALLADLLTGATRFGPLLITDAALFVSFLSLVAGFLFKDRELQLLVEARRIDLEKRLGEADRELGRYRNSSLTGSQAEEGLAVVEQLMTRDSLYRDHTLTLPSLARRAGVSPHHLSQMINDGTGVNFNRYVNGFRIDDACRILADSSQNFLTMDQICDRTGFNSLSVFNALFKERTGMTPSAWRRKHTR